MPTGNVIYNNVPFYISPWGNRFNSWYADRVQASNPVVLRIPCNKTIKSVNLLSNTSWGAPGPSSYASVRFLKSGIVIFEKMLIGNVDIRDYNQFSYTNTINGTTTVNAWTSTSGSPRIDNIKITLPSSTQI